MCSQVFQDTSVKADEAKLCSRDAGTTESGPRSNSRKAAETRMAVPCVGRSGGVSVATKRGSQGAGNTFFLTWCDYKCPR